MDSRQHYPNRGGGQYPNRGGSQGSNAYVSSSPPQQGTSPYLQNPAIAAPAGRGYQVQPVSSYGVNSQGTGGPQTTSQMYGQFQVPPPGPVPAPVMNPMAQSHYSYQTPSYPTMSPMNAGNNRQGPYSPVGTSSGSAEMVSSSVVDVPHIEKTAGGKYACPLAGCTEEYKDKSSATRHYRTKHGGPQERCSVCSREFPRGDSMQRHLKSQHGVGK